MSMVEAGEIAATAALAYYAARHQGNQVGELNLDSIELARLAELQARVLVGIGLRQAVDSDISVSAGYVPPPWVEPPSGRVPIDVFGTVAMPIVGANALILTFPVPEGYDGIIDQYALNYTGAGFVNGSGDLAWRVLADGRPIRNFSNILSQKGSENFPRKISGSGIPISSGQLITIIIDHLANAALGASVTASLMGYMYPRKGQQ